MARPLIKGDADAPGGGGVWGSPALDPAAASAPTSPAAAAITQETQVANEAARVAQAAAQLPPPPFGQPIIGADGRVSQAWIPWLTKLYQRSGGAAVTSASDLDILTEFDDLPVVPRSAAETLEWPEPAFARVYREVLDDGLWDEAPSVRAWVRAQGYQTGLGFTPVNKAGDTGLGAMSMDRVTAVLSGAVFSATAATTASKYAVFTNNGNTVYFGVENSGATTFAAPSPYMAVIYTTTPLWIRASGTTFSGQVGFNGTNAIAKPALNAAATDPATTMALVNQIRSALINYGLCS